MIFKLPNWLSAKAMEFMRYNTVLFCFALPSANTQIAGSASIASSFRSLFTFNTFLKYYLLKFLSCIKTMFFVHRQGSLAGPG
jgi:hypothetical protein